eukprot:7761900-Lingulodinium_polyedra.AAC.1
MEVKQLGGPCRRAGPRVRRGQLPHHLWQPRVARLGCAGPQSVLRGVPGAALDSTDWILRGDF